MTCAKVAGQIEITETAWLARRLGSDRLHQAESDVGSFDTSLDMCRGFTTLALDFEFRFEPLGKQGYAPLHGRRDATQRVYDVIVLRSRRRDRIRN